VKEEGRVIEMILKNLFLLNQKKINEIKEIKQIKLKMNFPF